MPVKNLSRVKDMCDVIKKNVNTKPAGRLTIWDIHTLFTYDRIYCSRLISYLFELVTHIHLVILRATREKRLIENHSFEGTPSRLRSFAYVTFGASSQWAKIFTTLEDLLSHKDGFTDADTRTSKASRALQKIERHKRKRDTHVQKKYLIGWWNFLNVQIA